MTTPYKKLSDLLRFMFSTAELRVFLHRLPRGKDLVDALPEGRGIALLAGDAVEVLERRGQVNAELFAQLVDNAPERYDDIADIARAWNVAPPPRPEVLAATAPLKSRSTPHSWRGDKRAPVIAVHEHPDFAVELERVLRAWNGVQDDVEFRGLTLSEALTERLVSEGEISVKAASELAARVRRSSGLTSDDAIILITEKRLFHEPDLYRLFVGGTDDNEEPPRTATISLEFPRFLQRAEARDDEQVLFRIVLHNLISIVASIVGLEAHTETRGCLMDVCGTISDISRSLDMGPGFCARCSKKIDQLGAGFLHRLGAAVSAQLDPEMVAHVEERLRERGRRLPQRNDQEEDGVDLVVLVALEEEFEQLRALVPRMTPVPDPKHGGYDYQFEVGPAGARYRCVARLIGNMGPERAGLFTDRLIARWRPAVVVMVGIAAGLHDDVRLADVVVAEQVDAYLAETKAVPEGREGWALQPRPRVFHGDHALLQEVANFRFVHAAIHDTWRGVGARDLEAQVGAAAREQLVSEGLLAAEPGLLRVHLASGPVVVAVDAFARWLRGHDSSVKAVEMEAAGLVEAAATRAEPIRALVIRGISDLGDERKSKLDAIGKGGLRRLAMRNATRLLLALLEAGVVPQGGGRV
jgi:nucleoside phosphorylase